MTIDIDPSDGGADTGTGTGTVVGPDDAAVEPVPTDASTRVDPDDLPPIPDPVKPRQYIEICPAETPVNVAAVEQAMQLLHGLLQGASNTGWRAKLTRSTYRPTVEWLLVSNGRSDPSIRYLVGSPDDDLLSGLERLLRIGFPNSYEFRHVEWHPAYLEEHLPVVLAGDPPAGPRKRTGPHHPAITPEHPYVAGVEYLGRTELRRDYQTPLTPFAELTGARRSLPASPYGSTGRYGRSNERTDPGQHDPQRVPTASLIEAVCDATIPVIVQIVCRLGPDLTGAAQSYTSDLERGTVTFVDKLIEAVFPREREEAQQYDPPHGDRARIEAIKQRNLWQTFHVSARAVALTRDNPPRADAVARQLTSVFAHVSGADHELVGRVATDDELYPGIGSPPGRRIYDDLRGRTIHPSTYDRYRNHLPGTNESKGIIVSPAELPGLCILDGAGLTPNGQRAVATRPTEQTGITLPPPGQLLRYRPPGMALGMPLTHDRLPYGHPFYLPVRYQDRHLIVAGDTGAGKSVLLETAMLTNVVATRGPEILFDTKGGGTAEEYLRAHFAAYGSLDDVIYFDLTKYLPAFCVLSIESLLDAGVPREEARSRKAGQYEETVAGVMGPEKYGQAAESVKAVRNHLRALFDPVHGSDVVSHADLDHAVRRTLGQRAPPTVSDDRLANYFAGLLERDRDMFNQIMGGAIGRVETVSNDGRLAPLFDHVSSEDGPEFDFTEFVNEDTTIVFDFRGMEDKVKRTLTLAILSNLWTALKAREEDWSSGASASPPQVNLYLEEAKDVAKTNLVDTLLSKGRSFGVSLALGVQYPEQLDSPETDTYRESLNETATIMSGKVRIDDDLMRTLATDASPTGAVDHRLNMIPSGEWLIRPGSDFGEDNPRPFLIESLPAPRGHPASDQPLTSHEERRFEEAFEEAKERTEAEYGISYEESTSVQSDRDADEPAGPVSTEEPMAADRATEADALTLRRIDSFLPHTKRLPECVTYDESIHAVLCVRCENRYDPNIEGLLRAIECCHSLSDVDHANIPIGDSRLKLSPEEIEERSESLKQLLFLQAVYNAQQRRYHPLEYDITRDSMIRLQAYVGIEDDEVDELIEAGLLRHDTDHPHRLYSVTPDGRAAIGEAYREGVDYGHGKGDLEESAEHVLGVAVGEPFLTREFIENPESAAVELSPYHEIEVDGERRRLDIAALDADGNVVVAVEVERINHDYRKAVPEDFDKMAACDLEEAIWIVMKQADGHKVLAALNDPPEGDPRVEKTYAETTPPQQFRIDTPGLTAIYPVEFLRHSVLDYESP